MAVFSFEIFFTRSVFITGPFPGTAAKHGEDLKSVKPATTQYFLREMKVRAEMDVQDGHTHTRLVIRVYGDAVADSFLCLCLGSLFDTGRGHRQPDGLTGGVTDRPPGTDPYPLNTLDARAPFRAK